MTTSTWTESNAWLEIRLFYRNDDELWWLLVGEKKIVNRGRELLVATCISYGT